MFGRRTFANTLTQFVSTLTFARLTYYTPASSPCNNLSMICKQFVLFHLKHLSLVRILFTTLTAALYLVHLPAQNHHQTTNPAPLNTHHSAVQLASGDVVRLRQFIPPGNRNRPTFELIVNDSLGREITRHAPLTEESFLGTPSHHLIEQALLPLIENTALVQHTDWECDLPYPRSHQAGRSELVWIDSTAQIAHDQSAESIAAHFTAARRGTMARSDGNRVQLYNEALSLRRAGQLTISGDPAVAQLEWSQVLNDSTLIGGLTGSAYPDGVYWLTIPKIADLPIAPELVTAGPVNNLFAQDPGSGTVYYVANDTLYAAAPTGDARQLVTVESDEETKRLLFYAGLVGVVDEHPQKLTITRIDPLTGAVRDVTRIDRPPDAITTPAVWWTTDSVYLDGAYTLKVSTEEGYRKDIQSELNYVISAGTDYEHPEVDLSIEAVVATRTIEQSPQEQCGNAFTVRYDTLLVTLANRGAQTIRSCDLVLLPFGRTCDGHGCDGEEWGLIRSQTLDLAPGEETVVALGSFGFSSRREAHTLAVTVTNPNDQVDVFGGDNYRFTEVVVGSRPEPAPVELDWWQDRAVGKVGLRNEANNDLKLQLFDATGRSITNQRVSGSWSFSTAELLPGVYFLSVINLNDGLTRTVSFIP